MSIKELENEFSQSLQKFYEEVNFLTESFEQSHNDEYLNKYDIEELGRQVFYTMQDFKNNLIKYLRESDR